MKRRHSSVSSMTMVNDTFPDSPHPNHPPTTGSSNGLPSSGQLFRTQPRATADPFPDTYQQQPASPEVYKPDLFPSSPASLPSSRSTLLPGGVRHMTATFGQSASASSLPSDSLYFVIPRQGSLSDLAPLAGSLPSPFDRPAIAPSLTRRYQELLDNIAIPFDYCANLIPLPPSPKELSLYDEPFRDMSSGAESTACKLVAGEAAITAERLSKIFDYADADVALRSSDRVLFMCHRANLHVHSTVFTELLSKGPPTNSREGLLGLDLAEDEEVLELMLQYLYPRPPPDLSNLGFRASRSLYEALCKYKVYSALRTAEMNLRRFLSVNPYEIFVVGVRWDSRELTERASTDTLRYDITAQAAETMEQVPSHALNRLWSMHCNRLRVVLDTLRNSLPEDGHGETEVTKYPDDDMPTCHAKMKEEWKGFRDARIRTFVNMLEPENFVDRFDRPECAGCRECLRLLTDGLRKAWDTAPNIY